MVGIVETNKSAANAGADFVKKIRKALLLDGDFPASAKVVSELRALVRDPKTSANQVTELILREPSLGTRVLHLVNSAFYQRSKPIMTVSQAVLQMGMRPIGELCAGLILLQRFVPAARRDGSFAGCLQRTIITSLLAGGFSAHAGNADQSNSDETGYLAGSFAELGNLLLAFYFPQVYEGAEERSRMRRQPLRTSIRELTGLTPSKISTEIITALNLPAFYLESLSALDQVLDEGSAPKTGEPNSVRFARALAASQIISGAITGGGGKGEVDRALSNAREILGPDGSELDLILAKLPTVFKEHCSSLEINLPALPDFISQYNTGAKEQMQSQPVGGPQDSFTKFVEEIRQSVESQEPAASIITTVMETFAWSLGFNRVLLLLASPNRKLLVGKMLIGGSPEIDPKSFEVGLDAKGIGTRCEVKAFRDSLPVFSGEPIFEDGWPIAAVPIGFGQRAVGVIYADKIEGTGPELGPREQAAIGLLAELLNKALGSSGRT